MPTHESSNVAHVSFYKTSEFIGIILLTFALTLELWFPWPLLSGTPDTILKMGGVALLVIGIVILRMVHGELNRLGQPHSPGIPTTKLVKSGPFRWSRNPTYTAIIFIIVPALGLLLRSTWILLLLPISPTVFYFVLIQEEEIYLKELFRGEWEDYCVNTPRWL
jgi:protein-S-isoprenylcysteine O-methyltransferase Ste14